MYVCICVYVCMYVNFWHESASTEGSSAYVQHVCMYACMCVDKQVRIYMYMYVYMCMPELHFTHYDYTQTRMHTSNVVPVFYFHIDTSIFGFAKEYNVYV